MNKYLLYNSEDKTIKKVKFENVLDDLYFLRCSVPSEENIKEYIKEGKDKKIKEYLKSQSIDDIINNIKKEISKINNKVPLYDEYTKNLLLISKELVYKKVIYEYYRFPDKKLIELLKERKKEIDPIVKKEETLEGLQKNLNLIREHRKLVLMSGFLKSFDIDILYDTYVKVFYAFANEVGKNITVCRRPSFSPYYRHIKPYYTRSELINLALNIEKIKPSDKYYDEDEVMKLCTIVKKNDITSDTILKHQEYIINQDKIGIIQYYSLQGSYFINQYLRNQAQYDYKNELLEKTIRSMWELTSNAPEFDKSYILYRFIQDDNYLKHLKIGDVYTDPSFISTTRDPFYRSQTYKFGFILIKIKIPANTRGVGLCIEPYSHFPEEEEIILSPLSKLKLEKKDENALYYHTDEIYASKIKTRYEFSYIGKEKINFVDRPQLPIKESNEIDFLKIPSINVFTVYEKVKQFVDDYVSDIYQFKTKIGDKSYDVIVEWYDSTNAYKNFYAATTNNGFSIYTIKDNYILFFIELGEEDDITYMYVNYYFRFSSSNRRKYISDEEFIDFISKVAYYFRIEKIILYAEYGSCDVSQDFKGSYYARGGNYCIDYYKYLKNKEKRFQNNVVKIDSTEVKPRFSYYELDRMRTVDPNEVLRENDRDELYQVYKKIYKLHIEETKRNLAEFYIWIIENRCVNVGLLINKMDRLYSVNNPFDNDYYVVDLMRYLYNKNLIPEIPTLKKSKRIKDSVNGDRVPKNEYRIQYYRKSRVPSKI
ncbi:ADP-ribosyltransferase exoenzyme domain protein [Indivirus ILV1]|uniref:ADP-ribosyltransferase exoenzyme domain protein n=1 Tax=Indivirus ILV1 TaxID=1977633 RepID=A0A1V0SCR5_9VIRU|nr:ADP-ribosyltransferase exoenzyme domain protein [Indivirus ILV1]